MSDKSIAPFRCILLPLVFAGSAAFAQTPPGADTILRETETLRPPPEPPRQEPLPLPEQPPAEGAAIEGAEETLFIRAFRVEHPEPLDAAEVEAALAPYAGRALTMAEIDAAVRVVTALYHARGFYLAQASLPPQDARDGTLSIQVTIGRYGAIRIRNEAPVREGLVRDIFAELEGETARRKTLERALLLASDLPGVRLPGIATRPGEQPGTMDMDITIHPDKRLGGFVLYDNQGSRYTGRDRVGAGVHWNSPLGLGDRLSLSGVYGHGESRHTGDARLSYALPVSPVFRIEMELDHSDYALGDQYEALDATGTADSVELGARYTALRGQDRTLTFGARFISRRLQDDFGLVDETTKKTLAHGTLDVRLEQWGRIGGRPLRGVARLAYTHGSLHYEDATQRAANRRGANTEGVFQKLAFSGSLDVAATPRWNLSAALAVQQALGKSLAGSEQIGLTGADAVRVYRESISADSGYTVRVEARAALPPLAGVSHSASVFADYGRGWFERPEYVLENGVATADIGLGYYAAHGPLFLRAAVAHKVGPRPDERLAKRDGNTHLLVQIGATF
ncbi:MAG: hypothetical protein LBP86_02130 [Azoarcus sp.]|nr:hypothetical protein [Azoarcus sp.]